MMLARTRRLLAAVTLLAAAAGAQSVEATLSRMDALSKGFRAVSADVKKISFTYFAKESDEESGHMSFYRPAPQDVRILMEFTKPEVRAIAFAKNKAQVYSPKANLVQEYNLGKEARLVDKFLVLGFGSSGAELRKNYNIKYIEAATLDGEKTDHLFLEPKEGEAKEHVRGIDLWIAQPGGYPIRMKVLQPSKDSVEFQYTNVRINPSAVTEASVKLKLPKGVKKETPQK